MDRRSPDSELETDRLLYSDEDRPNGAGAVKRRGGSRSPYDLACTRGVNPCLATNNNNNNDETIENHNVNNNGNSHCHSGECDRVAESSRTRQRNLGFSVALAPGPGSGRTQDAAHGFNGSTLSQHSGHKKLPRTNIVYESIPCQSNGYAGLPSQNIEYDVMGNSDSGRRRSSRLLEELSRRHCDSGVDLGEEFSGSLDFSSNESSRELVCNSETSSFIDDDVSKPLSTNTTIDGDSRHSSMSMNYEKVNSTVLNFNITSCDTSKCCPFYHDHHTDQCPNSVSEANTFNRQSVADSHTNKTPEYSENNLEMCSELLPGEHQHNDSTFRLHSSFIRRESGCSSSTKERHSDYESCEDNCDQMYCSDSGSSSYSECGPDCNCSTSPDQDSLLPQVRWTARLLGGNEQEVEAFKKKKMASMKK